MPYAWGYARVSDELQLGSKTVVNGKLLDNTSMETQEYAIRQWWQAHQHEFPDHTFYQSDDFDGLFRDPAQAASKIPLGKRPQGAMLLSFVQPRDIVIVTDGRRLFRDPLDYYTVKAKLKPMGVRLIYLNQPNVSWDSPEGELMGGLFAILGQHETDLMSARQKAAYDSRERRGIVTGPFIPLGYKKVAYLVDGELVKEFVPCKRERWWLRIFRWMRALDKDYWTKERFMQWAKENNVRRTPYGKKKTVRVFYWPEFVISEIVVTCDFPQFLLASARRGYLRDRLVSEAGRVPKRRLPAVPQRRKLVPLDHEAERLLAAPPGTTVTQLRYRQYRERVERQAAEAAPVLGTLPALSNSDSAS